MTMNTKNTIFKEKLAAWLTNKHDRDEKKKIIDAICLVTGMHRKSVSRKFKSLATGEKKNNKRGRKPLYSKQVLAALALIYQAAGEICGELLHPVINEYVCILKRDGQWKYDQQITNQLLQMSKSTVRRKVRSWSNNHCSRGLASTHESPLKHIIPIFNGPWDDLPPGNGQIDTVAHCGETLVGEYIYTLNYTDYATYWVQLNAQWSKGQEETRKSLALINQNLPFNLKMIHPDTGSEFINHLIKNYCHTRGIKMTRSRPSKSNDNMMVEERNGHLVRQVLGYQRLDNKQLLPLINQMLSIFCLHHNHFVPSRRTIAKTRQGAKCHRQYETTGKTPYQRTIDSPHISHYLKKKLTKQHQSLNPLILIQKYERIQQQIFQLQYPQRTS